MLTGKPAIANTNLYHNEGLDWVEDENTPLSGGAWTYDTNVAVYVGGTLSSFPQDFAVALETDSPNTTQSLGWHLTADVRCVMGWHFNYCTNHW